MSIVIFLFWTVIVKIFNYEELFYIFKLERPGLKLRLLRIVEHISLTKA